MSFCGSQPEERKVGREVGHEKNSPRNIDSDYYFRGGSRSARNSTERLLPNGIPRRYLDGRGYRCQRREPGNHAYLCERREEGKLRRRIAGGLQGQTKGRQRP